MGGTQGLGPIKKIVHFLDASDMNIQAVIACGTNKGLYKWLRARRFRKRVIPLAYAGNIDELMAAATVIVTKPGGITTAEALATGAPMLIVSPLPGQEAMNTRFLLREGVAVKAESPQDCMVLLEELLYNCDKLKAMSQKAHSLSKPDSAVRIAKLVLELVER
jgi:processive 1,2-diacylglycerol beta-glucosyltransferase